MLINKEKKIRQTIKKSIDILIIISLIGGFLYLAKSIIETIKKSDTIIWGKKQPSQEQQQKKILEITVEGGIITYDQNEDIAVYITPEIMDKIRQILTTK